VRGWNRTTTIAVIFIPIFCGMELIMAALLREFSLSKGGMAFIEASISIPVSFFLSRGLYESILIRRSKPKSNTKK